MDENTQKLQEEKNPGDQPHEAPKDDWQHEGFPKAESWSCVTMGTIAGAVRDAAEQAEEAAMALVSPDVTRHLVNAQQELLRAGVRIAGLASEKTARWGDCAISALEAKAARAQEIHAKKSSAKT